MAIKVNQDLLDDDGTAPPPGEAVPLPDGVFKEAEWASWKADGSLPGDREELFTVNGKVYTASKRLNPQIVFRYMRSIRKDPDGASAMSEMMYAVLGEAVMDALSDEDLTEEEFRQVMKIVEKHTMRVSKKALGK